MAAAREKTLTLATTWQSVKQRAQALEDIMKSERQPKKIAVKELSPKNEKPMKGGLSMNFTKIAY